MHTDWTAAWRALWTSAVNAWDSGRKTPDTLLTPDQVRFLATIGCSAPELFDFVDDYRRYGEPDQETALAVARLRREYFRKVLQGRPAARPASLAELPEKTDAVDGIAWLPRIIAKARLKLRGEMPPDLMYGCGGDRAFLRDSHLTLPQFLQIVWDSGDDDRRIIDAVKRARANA